MTRSTDIRPEEVLTHTPWLRALARTLVADAALADDVVQSTWLAAFTSPPARGLTRPWLAKSLRNIAHTLGRGNRRRDQRERDYGNGGKPELPTSSELCERLDVFRIVCEELGSLGEPYRSTIMLRYAEGLEPSEIARRQDLPTGTVRWRAHHGLKQLRERLDARFGGDGSTWIASLLLIVPEIGPPAPLPDPASGSSPVGLFSGATAVPLALTVAVGAILLGVAVTRTEARSAPTSSAEDAGVLPASARRPLYARPSSASRSSANLLSSTEPRGPELDDAETARVLLVHITILDDQGAPLDEARLTARRGDESRSSEADRRGRVELALPESWSGTESLELVATAAGHSSLSLQRDLLADAIELDLAAVRLEAVGSLSGTVVDARGRPVGGARVIALADIGATVDETWSLFGPLGDARRVATVTADDGSYVLGEVPRGSWLVGAGTSGSKWTWSTPVDVDAGDEGAMDVLALEKLPPELAVRGRVVDASGRTPTATTLLVSSRDWPDSMRIEVGDDGHFDFPAMPGSEVLVMAQDTEGLLAPSVFAMHAGESSAVQLGGSPPLELRVEDERGNPVAGIRIDLIVRDQRISWTPSETTRGEVALHLVDGSGSNQGSGLLDAPVVIQVSAPGYARGVILALDPPTSGHAHSHAGARVVKLTRLPRISGYVSIDGLPAGGTELRIAPVVTKADGQLGLDLTHASETVVDPSGHYSLPLEGSGRFAVVATSADRASAAAVETAQSTGGSDNLLDIVLGDPGSLGGQVFPSPGTSPAGLIVRLTREDGTTRDVRTNADGAYVAKGLAPGRWTVQVDGTEAGVCDVLGGTHVSFDLVR